MEVSTNRDVAVLGIGAQTAVGRSAPLVAGAVRAGISRYAEHPEWRDQHFDPVVVCRASWLPDTLSAEDRLTQLGLDAALEALEGVPGATSAPLAVVIGLPEPRPGIPPFLYEKVLNRLKEALSKHLNLVSLSLLPNGHASGLLALEKACELILSGQKTLCLAGGIDSYLFPSTVRWLDSQNRLHSLENRWGFTPGEGAGFCLLGTSEIAETCKPRPVTRIRSFGVSVERRSAESGKVCHGGGLTQAFQLALRGLPGEAKVAHLIGDLNGEVPRAEELGFAGVRLADRFREPGTFLAPADCWGDVGAASGPLFVALAEASARRGYARGPYHLIWAGSFGGTRCAALLETELPNG